MFENYSYKTKLKTLALIFCMLSYAAYKRSFSSLIGAAGENTELKKKVEAVDAKSKGLDALTAELATLDKVLGKEGLSKEKVQQDIISFITKEANDVSIYELKSVHEYADENHKIYTNQLDVTGGINQLLKLSYDFEKKFNLSRVVSVEFYTTKKNNKNDVLHLKMIFQNYENNK